MKDTVVPKEESKATVAVVAAAVIYGSSLIGNSVADDVANGILKDIHLEQDLDSYQEIPSQNKRGDK